MRLFCFSEMKLILSNSIWRDTNKDTPKNSKLVYPFSPESLICNEFQGIKPDQYNTKPKQDFSSLIPLEMKVSQDLSIMFFLRLDNSYINPERDILDIRIS